MKIRVLLAIMCLLFASCEKENSGSLTGTTWIQYDEYSDGHRSEYKMTFTSTDVTYTVSDQDGTHTGGFKGTYTYDAPSVTITIDSEDYLDGLVSTGTVKKGVMDIFVPQSLDMRLGLKLKKQ